MNLSDSDPSEENAKSILNLSRSSSEEDLKFDEDLKEKPAEVQKGFNLEKYDSDSDKSVFSINEDKETNIDPLVELELPSEGQKLEIRPVQEELYGKAIKEKNAIIFLETGQGKTLISVMVMWKHLLDFPDKKIAFIANTLNLVEQQSMQIRQYLRQVNEVLKKPGDKLKISLSEDLKEYHSGKTTPFPKPDEYKILVITAQTMLNALRRSKIKLDLFSLLVFDECHHCQSNHAYNLIFYEFYHRFSEHCQKSSEERELPPKELKERLDKRRPHILGLTAAPGDKIEVSTNAAKKIVQQINTLETNMDSKIIVSDGDSSKSKKEDRIIGYGNDQSIMQSTEDLLELCKNSEFYTYFDALKVGEYEYIKSFQEIVKAKEKTKIENLHLKKLLAAIEKLILEQSIIAYIEVGPLAMHHFILDFYEKVFLPVKTKITPQIKNTPEESYFKLIQDYLNKLISASGSSSNKYSEKFKKLCNVIRQHLEANLNQNIIIFVEMRYVAKMIAHYLKAFGSDINLKISSDYITGKGGRKPPLVEENIDDEKVEKHSLLYDEVTPQGTKQTVVKNNIISQSDFILNQAINELLREDSDVMNILEQMTRVADFRRKNLNVLVCTSVTEEGFDIPECGLVISYDPPRSPLSYIQIKGRARKEDSTYQIFVHESKFEKWTKEIELFKVYLGVMKEIVKAGKAGDRKKPAKDEDFYSKNVEHGVFLNTNWAVELLLMYCSYFNVRPLYRYYQMLGLGYVYTVALPRDFFYKKIGVVKGGFSKTKECARRQAAFKFCELLFKSNLITKRLRPIPLYYCGIEKYSLERNMIMQYADDPIINEKFTKMFTIFKKKNTFGLYPIAEYDAFKGVYTKEDDLYVAYLYKVHCNELLDVLRHPTKSDTTLGLVYFDQSINGLEMKSSQEEKDSNASVSIRFELVKKITLTLKQYKVLVHFMRYCECSIRSYDTQFFGYYLKKLKGQQVTDHFKDFHLHFKFCEDLRNDSPYLACLAPLAKPFNDDIDYDYVCKMLDHVDKLEERYALVRQKLTKSDNKPDGDFLKKFRSNPDNFDVVQSWSTFRKFLIIKKGKLSATTLVDKKNNGTSLLFEQLFNGKTEENDAYVLTLMSLGKTCEKMFMRKEWMIEKNESTDYDYNMTDFPLDFSFIIQLHFFKNCMNDIKAHLHVSHFKNQVLVPLSLSGPSKKILSWEASLLNGHLKPSQMDQLLAYSLTESLLKLIESSIARMKISSNVSQNFYKEIPSPSTGVTKLISINDFYIALSSKKFNSRVNYDRNEFLGDTILKLLSTFEVFASKPLANENELHHERARILNNYNLYRLAVKYDIYLYVFGKKPEDIPISLEKKRLVEEDVNQCLKEDAQVSNDSYANEMSTLENKFSGYQSLSYKVFADVVEALTGLYYKTGGLDAAQTFLQTLEVLSCSDYKYTIKELQNIQEFEGSKLLTIMKECAESAIGNIYKFKNPFYLLQACTHDSFSRFVRESLNLLENDTISNVASEEMAVKNDQEIEDWSKKEAQWGNIQPNVTYERLEFLGDALLDYYTVLYLFEKFPERDSGVLTALKSTLVNNALLSLISIKSGLGLALLHKLSDFGNFTNFVDKNLNKFIEDVEYYESQVAESKFDEYVKIAADVVEAFIGAVYLDSGQDIKVTMDIINALVRDVFDKLGNENKLRTNPQFLFEQHCKKNAWPDPEIKIKDKDPNQPGKIVYQLMVKDKMYAKYEPPANSRQYDIEKRLYKEALANVQRELN